jgi:DNA-binding transcriptional LysR family regulator
MFECVARLRNVSKASKEINLSQPAVTQAILDLEKACGIALFNRHSNGIILNKFGLTLYRRVRRMFAQIESALLELGIPNGCASIGRVANCITRSQIRCLTSVVEEGSIANASRRLELNSCTLLKTARELERLMRVPLFEQTVSGVVGTPTAMNLARRLSLSLREYDLGLMELEAAKGMPCGEIVIGVMQPVDSGEIAAVITEFASSRHVTDIRVVTGNAENLLRRLCFGELDVYVGLMPELVPTGLIVEEVAQTPYVVAASSAHPLASKSGITLDDLAEYEWVIGSPGVHRRTQFNEMFAGRKAPRSPIATCSLSTIRLLLGLGNRLSLLTTYELAKEKDGIIALSLGSVGCAPTLGIATREEWLPTQLQEEFLGVLRKQVAAAVKMDRAPAEEKGSDLTPGIRPAETGRFHSSAAGHAALKY